MKAIGNGVWEAPYGLDVPLSDAEGVPVFDISGYAETVITPQNGVRGARVFTDAGVADGETLTIVRVDGTSQIYTWKTALTPTLGEVLIGASNTTALANMVSAILGAGTPGTDYALNTEPVLDYEGTSDGTTITLTANNYGDYSNTAIAAFAEGAASGSWAAATSGVDAVDSLQYSNNSGTVITDAASISAQPVMRGGEWKIAPTAGQLTRKRWNLVLYDSSAAAAGDDSATSVFLRRQLAVVTTHHPAAGDPKGVLYCGVLDDPADMDLGGAGAYVEIPNLSHADGGDWLGGEYSVPDVDNIIANCTMEFWNPYTGVGLGWFAEVKSYDFTDAGFGTNQGRVTLAVGGGLPATIVTALEAGSKVYYRVYGSNIGRVAELAAQAKADVNAEVVDGLNVDTYAEPVQGAPGATITLAAKINYLYKAFRNRKTQTATVWSLFNDDATTVDHKATVADDGVTASKTEVATGP